MVGKRNKKQIVLDEKKSRRYIGNIFKEYRELPFLFLTFEEKKRRDLIQKAKLGIIEESDTNGTEKRQNSNLFFSNPSIYKTNFFIFHFRHRRRIVQMIVWIYQSRKSNYIIIISVSFLFRSVGIFNICNSPMVDVNDSECVWVCMCMCMYDIKVHHHHSRAENFENITKQSSYFYIY